MPERICHMDLGWGDNDKPCRKRVSRNPDDIRKHMIEEHGWRSIPALIRKDLKTPKEILTKRVYYDLHPEDWFYDNQLLWSDFASAHFWTDLTAQKYAEERLNAV